MNGDVMVKVATDFSRKPGARYRRLGPYSGEAFLDEVLRAAFQRAVDAGVSLIVDLDGTAAYATSFLEESFGGLSKEFGAEPVMEVLQIISTHEPDLIEEIEDYIREAGNDDE